MVNEFRSRFTLLGTKTKLLDLRLGCFNVTNGIVFRHWRKFRCNTYRKFSDRYQNLFYILEESIYLAHH